MKSGPSSADVSDLLAGLKQGVVVAVAALVLILPPPGPGGFRNETPASQPAAVGTSAAPFHGADFASNPASADARFVADWVTDSRDNGVLPFVILDKRDARVFVFSPEGRVVGSSPVLLGAAPGDDSAPDIGTRPMSKIRPEEKTTPAGRFVSAPGKNTNGEDVVWVDYDAAVSMHRVRMVDPKERRFERLRSPDPAQRRISYGCINVPVPFFESVIWPLFGRGDAVVYVLPEKRDVRQVFGQAYTAATKAARSPAAPART
jgi:hypothetical protein